jgi:ubiquinone/menaquinone biosynthesis C-methylase UbiE
VTGSPAWQDAANAELYDAYARTHPKYRDTSHDLVSALTFGSDAHVLDLACGTGITTEALLGRLGPGGSVTAVDGSDAMLTVAGRRVTDSRVRFLQGRPTISPTSLDRPLDASVCNSAIWQLGDIGSVFASVRAVVRLGGEFACNWGSGFVSDSSTVECESDRDYLGETLFEVARSHGCIPPRRSDRRRSPRPTVDDVMATLERAGFGEDRPRAGIAPFLLARRP